MKRRREEWIATMLEWAPESPVFIDETRARTNMARRDGRCLRGRRLIDKTPHGHWKTTAFVGALRHDGMTAPLVVDGAINGPIFPAYVQQHPAPTLRPGDVVVMDNPSAHKVSGVREAIEAAGASAGYLPPYSPDLNPIELAFSKLKSVLCREAERTVSGLWSLLGRVENLFAPDECFAYFRHCGYNATPS